LDRVAPAPALASASTEAATALTHLDLSAHAATKANARRAALAALREAMALDFGS
jgi:hypothetical protein